MALSDKAAHELQIGFVAGIGALIIQFLLGMAVNLFVTVPLNHPGANPPEYFTGVAQSVTWAILHGPVLLILHAAFGLLLVGSAIGLVRSAIRVRVRSMIVIASIGGVAILIAGFNGGSYLNYHEDFSSMLMATFFAIAVLAYAIGLYLTPRSA
jgi:hypothetical protein